MGAAYGLQFASEPKILDLGLLYRALADRQVDLVAGNSTDGVIAALGMVVLQDDRHYFPPYEPCPYRATPRSTGIRKLARHSTRLQGKFRKMRCAE